MKWPLRQTLEVYLQWRAAWIALMQDFSKVEWSLAVQSANRWVLSDVEDMEDLKEANRVKNNLQLFERYIVEYWGGAGVADYVQK